MTSKLTNYIYVETTVWQEPTQANHVYVFSEKPTSRTAKAIAYVRAGTKDLYRFKKPVSLDLKGRTFAALS